MLGHSLENDERGKSMKTVLALDAHAQVISKKDKSERILRVLAENGFDATAKAILQKTEKTEAESSPTKCFLCDSKFEGISGFVEKALVLLADYEYSSFLVGTELPIKVAEREDEFRAEFDVSSGESMRNEFGRMLGKKIAEVSDKAVNFERPEIVVLCNPFTDRVWLQVNPLFVAGRYKKLVRGIPQSKWFCSSCRGKGCEKCGWTGKMYAESVEEIVEKPFLDATEGVKGSFHASGREDIDARMLGNGRPFVVEIVQPKKRFLNLKKMQKAVNAFGKGKVEVSSLRFADKRVVRDVKGGESKQKEYRVTVEFEGNVTDENLRFIEGKLSNVIISQRTPIRVMHRRADLTREKYIYDVKAKKLSPHMAEMKVRCAGGLYVKELVTGDEGRTTPSVSELLGIKAKPVKLDVLKVIMKD
jgi:tRNA pseudouridine synthase 10